jgi:copper chaperone CopZ
VCTAAPKWASDGNKPESSEATTIGAQSGDGNEPESSDTITRGATADSNEIKSSPSQSRMAVHNDTSIDDVVSERPILFEVKVCCEKCVRKAIKEVREVPGVSGVMVDPLQSRVVVSGKADGSQVLSKLKKIYRRAELISVDKQKTQLASLALAPKPYPLCHPSWSIATGPVTYYDPVSYYHGDFSSHVPPMNLYHAYQVSSLQHSLYSSTPMCFLGTSSGFIRPLFRTITGVMPL